MNAEKTRLEQDAKREANWKRWGPYLAERQWGTVREDYSENGQAWSYFPHDHARSRVYRWGEDGLLGVCDRQGRLNLALALWNERDPILKERLFGVTGPQGNHAEDVKECYYYLESTPTHSYMKALYKYPQREYPYQGLVKENGDRGQDQPEYELVDTGIFDANEYFDVFVEYAKGAPNDLLMVVEIHNRGPQTARLHVLPTLWFRNCWSWGRNSEGYGPKPKLWAEQGRIEADHWELGRWTLCAEDQPELLFTDNETNERQVFGSPNRHAYVKDAFHRRVVGAEQDAVNPAQQGTKAACWYRLEIPAGGSRSIRLRLFSHEEAPGDPLGQAFHQELQQRKSEADEFYAEILEGSSEARKIARAAYASLLWSKQFYHYVIHHWLEGDPAYPPPPRARWQGRNAAWVHHLYNRDVLMMPDKWEYPWYASWDTAFHCVAVAAVDPQLAQQQLLVVLREWYMHPNGQIPAYEWNFSDTNPPVQAWAALRLYRGSSQQQSDRDFLERVFHKLLLNFTWWVNTEDPDGNNIFGGGFLGLDNIGIFDRSNFPSEMGRLEQSDATSWMAFYCLRLLQIALELARFNPVYEDAASKFFEHFVSINDAFNREHLWDEEDGFYYDVVVAPDGSIKPFKVHSMVGLLPLMAAELLEKKQLDQLPDFQRRLRWFLENNPNMAGHVQETDEHLLLALVPPERAKRLLARMLDPEEFLSDYGVRSLSRYHLKHPYRLRGLSVSYVPGESENRMFGGNSNWRGPIWFPVNFLLIEALERQGRFYQNDFKVDFLGEPLNLEQVADKLRSRLLSIFSADPQGHRPCHGGQRRYAQDPHWKELLHFHEYFHAETGAGLGSCHQGWTALAARLLQKPPHQKRSRPRRPG